MKQVFLFTVVLFVWCLACYLQKHIFHIEEDAYLMLYGYIVGSICTIISVVLQK